MLLIRQEHFGGIVFNTANGHKVYLDQGGVRGFIAYLYDNHHSNNGTAFGEIVCRNLDVLTNKVVYEIQNALPSLADNGLPVLSSPILVDLQITNYCNLACPHCYAGSSRAGKHVAYRDIVHVLDECAHASVFEVALGGGEPTLHPDLRRILRAAVSRGLSVNLATNGKEMNKKLAGILARYCGAVAISVEDIDAGFTRRRGYPFDQFINAATLLQDAGVSVMFQLTISEYNVPRLEAIIDRLIPLRPHGIVFLTYKRIGRGALFDWTLERTSRDQLMEILMVCCNKLQKSGIAIAYDCCLGNLIAAMRIGSGPIQGCSATIESIAVDKDLNVVPCSFGTTHVLGNLKKKRLFDIWRGAQASLFREKFTHRISTSPCRSCKYAASCRGGCPLFNLLPDCGDYSEKAVGT